MPSVIGITNLPNQYHKIISRKTIHYTLMLVGSSGLGKTTFINTLFHSDLKTSQSPVEKTVSMNIVRAGLIFLLIKNRIRRKGIQDQSHGRRYPWLWWFCQQSALLGICCSVCGWSLRFFPWKWTQTWTTSGGLRWCSHSRLLVFYLSYWTFYLCSWCQIYERIRI